MFGRDADARSDRVPASGGRHRTLRVATPRAQTLSSDSGGDCGGCLSRPASEPCPSPFRYCVFGSQRGSRVASDVSCVMHGLRRWKRAAFAETVDKVKTLMSALTLRAPAWAQAVPDDVLIERLMAGISGTPALPTTSAVHRASASSRPDVLTHSALPSVQSSVDSAASSVPSTTVASEQGKTAASSAVGEMMEDRRNATATGSGDAGWTAKFDE